MHTFTDETPPRPSSRCDPRVVALLDEADAHVAHIDAVLDDNEQRIGVLRELVAA